MPLGAVPAGAIAEVWGAPAAVFGGGAICAVFCLALLAIRSQRTT